jgi:hypothetical protein
MVATGTRLRAVAATSSRAGGHVALHRQPRGWRLQEDDMANACSPFAADDFYLNRSGVQAHIRDRLAGAVLKYEAFVEIGNVQARACARARACMCVRV